MGVNKETELQNKKSDGKLAKKKAKKEKQRDVLYQWQFVRSCYLWTKCICKLEFLKPLLYPLVEIIKGSIKTVENQIQYFPYMYHLIKNLNALSENLDCFIPTCDHLLSITQTSISHMNKISKQRNESKLIKGQDIEISTKYSNETLTNMNSIENIIKDIDFLFFDALGIFSRSPSFPEIITPILIHIKKIVKKCSSSNTRKLFDRLKSNIETSQNEVRSLRENITTLKDEAMTKFLIYDSKKISISKLRLQMVKSKLDEEKLKVESEQTQKEDELKDEKERKLKDKEEKKESKKLKRELKEDEDEEEAEQPKKKKNRQERILARALKDQQEKEKQMEINKKRGKKTKSDEVMDLEFSESEE